MDEPSLAKAFLLTFTGSVSFPFSIATMAVIIFVRLAIPIRLSPSWLYKILPDLTSINAAALALAAIGLVPDLDGSAGLAGLAYMDIGPIIVELSRTAAANKKTVLMGSS